MSTITKKMGHEPLFHLTKRSSFPGWAAWIVRLLAIAVGFIVCGLVAYILIEDKMRPCPAGKGCTARRTRRLENRMKKPKWDTELGRLMWLEGKKDGEIADAFGIPTSSVTSYRVRHWQKELIRKEDSPPRRGRRRRF